ncbi:MAG: PHP domain-containing protein [Thermodesulfovibrionales bacterium]|nr:PHP domain-containing protein [Thermodesulfovibrionales bacterium]
MFKIDLHIHSRYSEDNDADPEEIIERAIELGLDGIAFTEHYYYKASAEIEPLIEKYRDIITIIRGVEFSALDGHCLVFGVDTDDISGKEISMAQLVKIIDKRGGITIPAHPFRGTNSIGESLFRISGLFAIEGLNGYSMPFLNEKAIRAAAILNIPYTGGSDAHSSYEVGSCYTSFYEPVNQENIVRLIKSGNFKAHDSRRVSRLMNFY